MMHEYSSNRPVRSLEEHIMRDMYPNIEKDVVLLYNSITEKLGYIKIIDDGNWLYNFVSINLTRASWQERASALAEVQNNLNQMES